MKQARTQARPDPITQRAQTRARRVIRLLRAARLRLGLNQPRLARRAGLTQTCVSGMEANRNYPALDTAFRVLEALRVEAKRQNRAQGTLRKVEKTVALPKARAKVA